jgi:uncharacterized protein DUF3592
MKKYGSILFGLIFLLSIVGLGVWLAGSNIWGVWVAIQSKSWPSTRGTITASDVCEAYTKSGTEYYPCIQYQYTVNNKVLTGDQIYGVHRQPGDYYAALDLASKYAVGTQVLVYYDPRSPETACLEPGVIPWQTYGAIVAGLFFAGFPFYLLSFGFSKKSTTPLPAQNR